MRNTGELRKCARCGKVKVDVAFSHHYMRKARSKICKECINHKTDYQNLKGETK